MNDTNEVMEHTSQQDHEKAAVARRLKFEEFKYSQV